mmetsp:Transcript_16674/g.32481  ORF Transcript_16674/g.32481 Transcript_16674/m.32481 type:complete len:187 (-) Transcript_16674:20-580(-)
MKKKKLKPLKGRSLSPQHSPLEQSDFLNSQPSVYVSVEGVIPKAWYSNFPSHSPASYTTKVGRMDRRLLSLSESVKTISAKVKHSEKHEKFLSKSQKMETLRKLKEGESTSPISKHSVTAAQTVSSPRKPLFRSLSNKDMTKKSMFDFPQRHSFLSKKAEDESTPTPEALTETTLIFPYLAGPRYK